MPRIPTRLRHAVIESSQGRCAYCRSPETHMGVSFEVDHVIPRSAGGRTTLANLCLTCPTCNRYKASRVSARDPVTRRIVRLFQPNRDNWSEHFAWNDNGSEIIGLSPTGRATAAALRFNRPAMTLLRQYWRTTGVKLD